MLFRVIFIFAHFGARFKALCKSQVAVVALRQVCGTVVGQWAMHPLIQFCLTHDVTFHAGRGVSAGIVCA